MRKILLVLLFVVPMAYGQTHIVSSGGGGSILSLGAQLANCILAGPTSGAAAVPTCRPMVALDMGTGLSPTFNIVNATSFIGALTGNATNVTGVVTPLHGGTGQDFSSSSGFMHFNSGTASLVPLLSESDVTNLTTDLSVTEKVANKNQVNGYAGLDSNGKLLSTAIPSIAITDTFVVGSQAAMLALSTAETGDVAIRTDINQTYILRGTTFSVLSDWSLLATPTDSVTSVAGRTGVVTLAVADVTGAEATVNKDTANGYAGLNGSGKVVGTEIIYGSIASTAAQGNDSRLSDSRTPTAHATSHASAGSDPVTLAESQVTGLVTDLAGKQAVGNYVIGLSGDITATGPGTVAATLATVNSSPGTFGSGSLVPVVTVNAKGLATTVTTTAIIAATPALNNLASVAINASLLPSTDNLINIGSSAKQWASGFFGGSLTVKGTANRIGTATTADALADTLLATSATSQKSLVVQGKAGQSANLQEWQVSNSAAVAFVNPSGDLTAHGISSGVISTGVTSGAGVIAIYANGFFTRLASVSLGLASDTVIGWTSSSDGALTKDTSVSRVVAGVTGFGTGAGGSVAGSIRSTYTEIAAGANVASASTITPTSALFHVTGTTQITTINLPRTGYTGCLRIVPDGAFTTATGGNIALASTAVVSRALEMCFDGSSWFPSY